MGLDDDGGFAAAAARQLPLENRHDSIHLNLKHLTASAQRALDFGTPRQKCFPRREFSATRTFPPGCGRNAPPITTEEHSESVSSGKGNSNSVGCKTTIPNLRPSEKEVKNEAHQAGGKVRDGYVCRHFVMGALNCPLGRGKQLGIHNSNANVTKHKLIVAENSISSPARKKHKTENSEGLTTKKKVPPTGKVAYLEPAEIIAMNRDENVEALKQYRNFLKEEEKKSKKLEYSTRRIDILAFERLKRKRMWCSRKAVLGSIPGVKVGDKFKFRYELKVVGLHRHHRWGIDYLQKSGNVIATSIVASGGYDNYIDDPDVLLYSGHGGMPMKGDKRPKDQKLERGNLALKNSIDAKNVVRVILGSKEMKDSDSMNARGKIGPYYVYNGLYLVETYEQETGYSGATVFKFWLRRLPDQPNLHLGKKVQRN